MTRNRRPLRDLIRRYKRRLGLQALLSLLSSVAEALLLVAVVRLGLAVLDGQTEVVVGSFSASVRAAAVLMVFLLVLKLLLNVLTAWTAADLGRLALTELRIDLLRSFFGARWEALALERQGQLQDLVGTDGDRAALIPGILAALAAAATSFFVVVLAAVVISPAAAAASVIVGALLAFALKPLVAKTRVAARESQRLRSLLSSQVSETARLALEVRVYGVEQGALENLEREHRALEGDFRRMRFNVQLTPYLYQNAVLLLIVAAAWALSLASSNQVDQTGAALLLLLRAFSYGQMAQTQYQSLLVQEPSLEAIIRRRDELANTKERSGPERMPEKASLRFKNVSFSYPDGDEVLTQLDFEVAAGESIGIIGPSGAGKSTILEILLRLREPTTGSFEVAGLASGSISLDEWHDNVAFVPQEPKLISGSVFENIVFFREAEREDVELAARLAHVEAEVRSRPLGFDESVGEGGSAFSGGQRQRITIARALLGRPNVLILDEPTSSLDGESEAGLHRTLEELRGSLTLIVVSHRMSTLAKCDRVLVLDNGRIEAFDSHERLLECSPFYVNALQHAGLGPS